MTTELKQEYQWNINFDNKISNTDVNKVAAELNIIQETKGEVSPEDVIEHSKNKKSILHDYFLWDDKKAAHKWRIHQASALLRGIEIRVVKDGESKTLRAFEVTSNASNFLGTRYISFDNSVRSMERAKEITITDLVRSINRLSTFNEFNSIVAYLSIALEELQKETELKAHSINNNELSIGAEEARRVSVRSAMA